jgi:hypothetical protein
MFDLDESGPFGGSCTGSAWLLIDKSHFAEKFALRKEAQALLARSASVYDFDLSFIDDIGTTTRVSFPEDELSFVVIL